jgi:hypothetical protein
MPRSPDSLLARTRHNLAKRFCGFKSPLSPPLVYVTRQLCVRPRYLKCWELWELWQDSGSENLSCLAIFTVWEPELLLLLLVVIHTMRTTISTIHTMRNLICLQVFLLFIYLHYQRTALCNVHTKRTLSCFSVHIFIGCVQCLIALELLFPSSGKFQWPFPPWILLFDVVFDGLDNIVDFCVVKFVGFTDLKFLWFSNFLSPWVS